MSETRTQALAVRTEPVRAWTIGATQAAGEMVVRTGAWAVDTAQHSGALLAILMGPAIFSIYAIAAWSLASNLGWTETFLFQSGPLSNWMVWFGIAALLSIASNILRRHIRPEKVDR